ncbi:hypothetical protein KW801_01960 [Candidatus Saccharibacteria bacterium]|nr:hypothetical protein [Candidatus Saccharibacteria bacterium]
MVEIVSESEISSHRAGNFFRPSAAEIGLYFLLSIILLIVYNSGSIIQKLGSNYIGSPEHLKTNFDTLSSGFSNSFSTALGGRLGQIILWSFVGALAYIALWLAKNVLNSFENDIISDHYLHPKTYSRVGYWGSSFSVKIFLAAMLLISAGFLFVAVRAVLPSVAALAGSAAYNFHWSSGPYYLAFSVVGVALVIYIGVVLLRLVSHFWKLL